MNRLPVAARVTQPVAPRPQRISGSGFQSTAEAARLTAPVTMFPGDWMALAMLFLRSVRLSMGIGVYKVGKRARISRIVSTNSGVVAMPSRQASPRSIRL